ncbi:MAG: glycosyltransferase family 4 protein [Alistipes sp.]|jgi:glycosyltransferase involved in cell wall biosynthesis|nr:glycosyltransferase family 4 protein [Alistipes sp.]
MKIAFLIKSLQSSAGTERMATVIANGLVRSAGTEVDVITIHGCTPFFELDGRIRHFSIVPHKEWSRVMRHFGGYVLKLRRILKREGYDYVIDVDTVLSLLSLPAAAGLKTRVVSWEHFNANVNWGKFSYPLARRMASRLAHRVVVLTQADKALYGRRFGARNAVCIPNPVTVNSSEPSPLAEKRFVAVGRLHPQKGYDMLLDAWASTRCRREGWTLRIVGSGRWEERLGAQIDRLGVADSVEMLPATHEVEAMFRSASCFVLSSRFEGLPLVLIEAAAMGLPAVSFDCETGPREIIEDASTGLLVPPGDVGALAAAMDEMAADGEMRARMGAAALERSRLFSPGAILERWRALLGGETNKPIVE